MEAAVQIAARDASTLITAWEQVASPSRPMLATPKQARFEGDQSGGRSLVVTRAVMPNADARAYAASHRLI
jgi:hypothetical protein